MDTLYRTLMAAFHAIHDRATLARYFHQLMGQCTHLEMSVQYGVAAASIGKFTVVWLLKK
jgi:hypothetical protein